MGVHAEAADGSDVWHLLPVESRLIQVVDALPMALVLSGLDGHIEMVNERAERMFGYDRDELRDKPLEALMPTRFHDAHNGMRNQFAASRTTRPLDEGSELFGIRKDGTEFPMEIDVNAIHLEGSSMVVASIVDITARRMIEREREQKCLELVRSNADLEEFAYVASHDLKAPLRAISNLAQWISEDVAATASVETTENLKLLRGRVMRLQSLMDGLLAYARIGRSLDNIEDVDIANVVGEVVSELSPPPGIIVAFQGPRLTLRTHRASLQVVLQNLIGNAVRHHDRAEGLVTISARRVDGLVEFRVSDDGPGIAERFHDRIFVMFQTLASRDDVEASGIGLAIVKKRIEGHGGRIRVESSPPVRGTNFVFTWKEAVE
jgi:PAS domain S-box-containing protein